MSSSTITTFLVLVATAGIGMLLAVSIGDPLTATVTSYNLAGMESQVTDIHVGLVKYMPIVAIASALLWAVLRLLRTERQRV